MNTADFIRKLSSRPSTDFGDIAVHDLEVFVVMPDDAGARHVMRELQACGYRVNREGNSFKAMEIAAMTRPDPVIVTGVLDLLSGVDVVSAFRAMPATRDIPVALITGDSLEEALADALSAVGILYSRFSPFRRRILPLFATISRIIPRP